MGAQGALLRGGIVPTGGEWSDPKERMKVGDQDFGVAAVGACCTRPQGTTRLCDKEREHIRLKRV